MTQLSKILAGLGFSLVVATAQAELSILKTFERSGSDCTIGNQKFRVEIRGKAKKPSNEESQFGSPYLFVGQGKLRFADGGNGTRFDDEFTFVKPEKGSICEQAQAVNLGNNKVAILYLSGNRPKGPSVRALVYDAATSKFEKVILGPAGFAEKSFAGSTSCRKDSECHIAYNPTGCLAEVSLDPTGTASSGKPWSPPGTCNLKKFVPNTNAVAFAKGAFCRASVCMLDMNISKEAECTKGFGSADACLAALKASK